MRKILVATILLTLLTGSSFGANVKGFYSSWKDVLAAAKKEDKPIYLHFTTTWCSWCRRIEDDTYASKEGKAALADFVAASLDCTVGRGKAPAGEKKINIGLMKKWGGSGYPFLVMVTPDGVVLNAISGYLAPGPFAKALKLAKEANDEYKEFLAYAKKADKKSYEYNIKAMTIYAKVKKFNQALIAAKMVKKLDPENKKGDALKASNIMFLGAVGSNASSTQIDRLLADIVKLDPKNAEGVLQSAVWTRSLGLYMSSHKLKDASKNRMLAKSAKTLEMLTVDGVELESGDMVYALLAYIHVSAKNEAKCVEAAKKSLEINPEGPRAKQLKDMIKKYSPKTNKK